MSICAELAAALRNRGRPLMLVALCGLVLTSCAHPVLPMRNDRTIVISGKRTAGSSDRDAAQRMLVTAARLTLDHGFRYFELVGVADAARSDLPEIRPGVDVTIRVYRAGEIDPHRPGMRDAESVAAVAP